MTKHEKINFIVELICKRSNIDREMLKEKTRGNNIPDAKHKVRYFLHKWLGLKTKDMANITNGDHAAFWYSRREINNIIDLYQDRGLRKNEYEELNAINIIIHEKFCDAQNIENKITVTLKALKELDDICYMAHGNEILKNFYDWAITNSPNLKAEKKLWELRK